MFSRVKFEVFLNLIEKTRDSMLNLTTNQREVSRRNRGVHVEREKVRRITLKLLDLLSLVNIISVTTVPGYGNSLTTNFL